MKIFENIEDVKAIRKKTGMNQIDFWGKVGVTQSGGSRYETGRKMPKPVRELLRLVHIECLDLAKVNKKRYGNRRPVEKTPSRPVCRIVQTDQGRKKKTRLNRNLRMPGGFSFPKNANNAV